MKYIITAVVLSLMYPMTGCQDKEVVPTETITLTAEEQSDLQYLREEEKLARDVYRYAFDKYNLQLFSNISGSEQKHMDEVLVLLTKYNLTDSSSNEAGKFHNAILQQLYTDLIAKVDLSVDDALVVGATIEDLDIYDLSNNMSRTTKNDLLSVYSKLQCGSRNHLRGFTGQLTSQGGSYTPQYISQEAYDSILAGSHENCGG